MATPLISPPYNLITSKLQRGLSGLPAVRSGHIVLDDDALAVWVALRDGDDEDSRSEVYKFEDEISAEFPDVLFDFHIIDVPNNRRMEDYLSIGSPIFERIFA